MARDDMYDSKVGVDPYNSVPSKKPEGMRKITRKRDNVALVKEVGVVFHDARVWSLRLFRQGRDGFKVALRTHVIPVYRLMGHLQSRIRPFVSTQCSPQ